MKVCTSCLKENDIVIETQAEKFGAALRDDCDRCYRLFTGLITIKDRKQKRGR